MMCFSLFSTPSVWNFFHLSLRRKKTLKQIRKKVGIILITALQSMSGSVCVYAISILTLMTKDWLEMWKVNNERRGMKKNKAVIHYSSLHKCVCRIILPWPDFSSLLLSSSAPPSPPSSFLPPCLHCELLSGRYLGQSVLHSFLTLPFLLLFFLSH